MGSKSLNLEHAVSNASFNNNDLFETHEHDAKYAFKVAAYQGLVHKNDYYDIYNASLLGLWKASIKFDPMKAPNIDFCIFARTICRQSIIDWLRRYGSKRYKLNCLKHDAVEPSFTPVIDDEDEIENILNRLPNRQKEVLTLLFHGYPVQEVMKRFNISQLGVHQLKKRALMALKRRLRK